MAAHRQAFPTPRGATRGCPPDTVCGGRAPLRGPRTSSRAPCGLQHHGLPSPKRSSGFAQAGAPRSRPETSQDRRMVRETVQGSTSRFAAACPAKIAVGLGGTGDMLAGLD